MCERPQSKMLGGRALENATLEGGRLEGGKVGRLECGKN